MPRVLLCSAITPSLSDRPPSCRYGDGVKFGLYYRPGEAQLSTFGNVSTFFSKWLFGLAVWPPVKKKQGGLPAYLPWPAPTLPSCQLWAWQLLYLVGLSPPSHPTAVLRPACCVHAQRAVAADAGGHRGLQGALLAGGQGEG